MFPYMKAREQSGPGSGPLPKLKWNTFNESKPFSVPECGDLEIIPLPVEKGRQMEDAGEKGAYLCLGFRIGDFSYISDANFIPETTMQKMHGTRVLVLDAMRERSHSSHMNFQEV
jgi:phosphoribosyl 1,2-cyclic phosphodiesterase